MYAIVGAAAVLSGVTHMTICLAVIVFEITGGAMCSLAQFQEISWHLKS